MLRFKRLSATCIALSLCLLLAGFFGGEKPQDAITALITAIENNDANAFHARVSDSYFIDAFRAKFSNEKFDESAYLHSSKEGKQARVMIVGARKEVGKNVSNGSFSNICRKNDGDGMPFAPEMLQAAKVSEPGKGAEEGTATVSLLLKSNEEVVLGLAEVNKKWIIVALRGNRKAAADQAAKIRIDLLDYEKMLAERRKNADLYMQEMKARTTALYEAAKNNNAEGLKKILTYLDVGSRFTPAGDSLDSPALWEAVAETMADYKEKSDENPMKFTKERMERYVVLNEHLEIFAVEVIAKNKNMLLVQYPQISSDTPEWSVNIIKTPQSKEFFVQRREKWLRGEFDPAIDGMQYELYRKEGNLWKQVAYAEEDHKTKEKAVATFIEWSNQTFTPLQYMQELMKRYDELDTTAKKLYVNRKKWTDELQVSLKGIDEAIAKKDTEALAALIDLPRFLRDVGTVKETAIARLDNAQSNADIAAFNEAIKTKTVAVLEGPLTECKPYTIIETRATLRNPKGIALLFEREKAGAPWKLMQQAEYITALSRPDNWQAQVEAEMKTIQAVRDQKAAEEKIAEEKRIAAEKAEAERLSAEKAAEEKRIAEEKAAEEKRIAEEKAAEEKRIAEEKAAEEARLAQILADASPKLVATLNSLADALDKKDPDAALAVLGVNVLSLCPNSDCTRQIMEVFAEKVAPTAGFVRKFSQAVKDGKPMEGFETLWETPALRKAVFSLPSVPASSEPLGYIATIQTQNGPRSMGIGALNNVELILTAPQAEQDVLTKKLRPMLNEVWFETFADFQLSPIQENLQSLANALREKKGEDAAAFVNFGFATYWKLNDWNAHEALAACELFPNSPETMAIRKTFVEYCNATGIFKIAGAEFSADTLENATVKAQNALGIVTISGVPCVFADFNGVKQFINNAQGLDDYTFKNLSETYKNDSARIKAKKPEVMQKAAALACVRGIMDTVKLSDPTYTLMQENDTIYLVVKAVLNNTNTFPVTLNSVQIELFNEDVRRAVNVFSINEQKELQPSKPVLVEWKLRPTAGFNMVFLDNQQPGWSLQMRVSRLKAGKTVYTMDNTYNINPVDKGDGTWQVVMFPPVRPTVSPETREQQKQETERLDKAYAEHEQKMEAEFIKNIPNLMDKIHIAITVKDGQAQLSATSKLPREVYLSELEAKLTDKSGVEIGSAKDTWSKIKPGGIITAPPTKEFLDMFNDAAAGKGTMEMRATHISYDGLNIRAGKSTLIGGLLPSLTFTDNAVISTYSEADAKKPKPAQASPATPKQEEKKQIEPAAKAAAAPKQVAPEQVAPEAPKADAPKTDTAGAITSTTAPTPSVDKKPGKAVRGVTTMDVVGLTAFGPDGKPDSAVRISAVGASPLVGIRIDNMGGTAASWKTKDVKTAAKGVVAVLQGTTILNPQDAALSIDVTKPVVLDLLVQDNGILTDGKTAMRVVFFHKDGSRSYATLESAKK